MRAFLVSALVLGLCGCSIIYKLPTRQGNVIEQKDLDKLKVGMTRDQVKFVMGTPIASTPFRTDRWDYVGYYKSPRGDVASRVVTLYFADNALSRMDGIAATPGTGALSKPDVKTVIKDNKPEGSDRARDQGPPPAVIGPEQQP